MVAGAAFGAATLAALTGRRRLRRPQAAPVGDDAPLISVVVPARNEARDVAATLRGVLAQRYPRLEVVAVDDCSSDGTAEAIAAVAAEDPRLTLIRGREAPDGWLGKPWAISQGVERTSGAWLCFTDADIDFHPDTLAAALAFARQRGGGGCTLTPLLLCGSFWERVVQPVAAMTIASFVAPPLLAERPGSRVALAAGGFMLVERGLYERAGGHAGVRDRVADDISLARNVKRAGGLLALGAGDELVRVRMYHGAGELFRGWRKNTAYGLPGPAGSRRWPRCCSPPPASHRRWPWPRGCAAVTGAWRRAEPSAWVRCWRSLLGRPLRPDAEGVHRDGAAGRALAQRRDPGGGGRPAAGRAEVAGPARRVRSLECGLVDVSFFDEIATQGHEQVVICHEPESGLRAIIAIHDTTLGPVARRDPAAGTTRATARPSATSCGCRAAMTYKAAVAGLDQGGGKTVVIATRGRRQRGAASGRSAASSTTLGGRYIAAEDVGTSPRDMDVHRARDAVGDRRRSRAVGGSGDPSPLTAIGRLRGDARRLPGAVRLARAGRPERRRAGHRARRRAARAAAGGRRRRGRGRRPDPERVEALARDRGRRRCRSRGSSSASATCCRRARWAPC